MATAVFRVLLDFMTKQKYVINDNCNLLHKYNIYIKINIYSEQF